MSNQDQWLPSQGDVLAGRYRLDSEIGAGGFAVAWKATDTDRNRTVVVKHPNLRSTNVNLRDGGLDEGGVIERFEQEISILQDIRDAGGHPKVMSLYDSFTHRGLSFAVIEYIDGTTLEDRFDDRVADADTARQIGVTLADILSFIHENEAVYRDLKPDNVMMTPSGEIRLIDLNSATDIADDAVQTSDGSTKFGEHVMYPPEMKQSKYVSDPIPLGPHTDVYCIGRFIFWLVAGHVPPEDGKGPQEMGVDVPDYLDAVIRTATQSAPNERYNNAVILGRALQERDPEPPETARIDRVQGAGTHQVNPGDTLGRQGADPPPAIPIRDEEKYVSAVQVKFDADRTGQWYISDESTNGTYVNKGDGHGWRLVLSDRGKRKLRQSGHDVDESAPTQLEIDDGDLIALVDPKYGLSFRFRNL